LIYEYFINTIQLQFSQVEDVSLAIE